MEATDLQINDLFWTLQGEGAHSGRRALFVRLPYCNYDCPWCDTEYNSFKKWTLPDFRTFAQQEKTRFAVITGGEPMAHKHLPVVIETLKELGFTLACETNGSLPVPDEIDFVTTSPKAYTKGKYEPYFVDPKAWKSTNEWKYVVDRQFDFTLLDRHKEDSKDVLHSLSPEYNEMSKNVKRIIEFIKNNPQWKLSLQTHKWINIP